MLGKIRGKLNFCMRLPVVILNMIPKVPIDPSAAKVVIQGQRSPKTVFHKYLSNSYFYQKNCCYKILSP